MTMVLSGLVTQHAHQPLADALSLILLDFTQILVEFALVLVDSTLVLLTFLRFELKSCCRPRIGRFLPRLESDLTRILASLALILLRCPESQRTGPHLLLDDPLGAADLRVGRGRCSLWDARTARHRRKA
jgi:hypothetical protein